MGCCWPPHYVLTFSLFLPIFPWQIKLTCWSVHGASLTHLNGNIFFLNLCQETLPTVCNVSKPEVNTSMVKQITLWWYSPAPTWFEINNPHFLISLFLCWLPGGSCTFELNLKQFNINRNELGSAPPQISLCSEDQPDTSPAVTAVGVCTT